jgi:hypothetical protein
MTQQRVSPIAVTSLLPATVLLKAQAASGQSADLLQLNNSSATTLVKVDSSGNFYAPSLQSTTAAKATLTTNGDTGGFRIDTGAAANKGLIVKAAASQTGNLQEWQNSGGTNLTYISSAGIFYPDSIRQQTAAANSFGGTPISGVILTTKTGAAGNVGVVVQGSASQSVDLQRWQDSTPTVLARVTSAGAITSAAATAGIGYETGAGGTATQGAGSGKSTAVTLSKVTGQVTMNNAALAANTTVSFVLTNTAIAATDMVYVSHISGGTLGSYTCTATPAAGSATIYVRNVTAGSLSEAIVLQFVVIKAVTA